MTLEDQILLHRYCYYVLASPLIPDVEYDKLEVEARKIYPEDSVVHKIGSCLPSSYPEYIKNMADNYIRTKGIFLCP